MLMEVVCYNGDAVRRILAEIGWTTTDLAYHLGITESAVQRWYWGNSVPKLGTVVKIHEIAKALVRPHVLRKIVAETPAPKEIDGVPMDAIEGLRKRLAAAQNEAASPLARSG